MSQIREWLKGKLVADWRSSWKWLSVQLAALAGLVIGWIFASPLELLQILYMIPAEVRVNLSPFVTVAVVAVVVGARLWKQGHPKK